MKKKINSIIREHQDTVEYFANHGMETLMGIAGILMETFSNKGKLLLCGNGGSMADCQHIAGELVGKFRKVRKPLPAVALSTDAALTTCISNDFSYEDIFARQIEALGTKGDTLWAFSTSGSSENVLSAVRMAKRKGLKVVGFTGVTESPLEALSDICLCAHSNKTNHSQEVHELAYHIICEIIDDSIEKIG